jgi:hypothetical protein
MQRAAPSTLQMLESGLVFNLARDLAGIEFHDEMRWEKSVLGQSPVCA